MWMKTRAHQKVIGSQIEVLVGDSNMVVDSNSSGQILFQLSHGFGFGTILDEVCILEATWLLLFAIR